MNLSGRRALVTGAARGIGRGIAEVLAERGAAVAINDVDGECAEAAARTLRGHGAAATAVPGDVSKRQDVERMFEQASAALGPIDILVNNAGIETIVPFLELTDDQWTRLVDVNLRGAWLCSQVFCRRARGRAPAGQHRPHRVDSGREGAAGTYALCAGEAGARGADAQHVCGDDAARHSRQLHPSGADRYADDRVDHEGRRRVAGVLSQISLGRAGQPREIGAVAAFLVSDDASYLTGQSIYVDGGWQGK